MRIFDLLTVCAVSVAATLAVKRGNAHRLRGVLATTAVLLLMAHLVWEGARWQMAPAYLALTLLLSMEVESIVQKKQARVAIGSTVIALAACSLVLSWMLPIFRLPKPTGRFQVGTTTLYFTDTRRDEDAGTDPKAKREVVVQLWYPASPSHRSFAVYQRLAETTLLTSYRSVVPTNSKLNAPIADSAAPFPILIFGGGWRGRRTECTFLTEDLASHGYVVAAVDHPYNAHRVALADGSVIDTTVTWAIGGSADISPQGFIGAWDTEMAKWTADDLFALDQLSAMNEDPQSRWFHRLNTNLAGAFGHSFGGAASIQASSEDSRIRSSLNMDGYVFGAIDKRADGKPMMLIYESESAYPGKDPLSYSLDTLDIRNLDTSLQTYGGYRLYVDGANHEDFSDQPLMSPLRQITDAGTMPPKRVHEIVRAYVLAFFNKTLLQKDSTLLRDGKSPFHDVTFERWTSSQEESRTHETSGLH